MHASGAALLIDSQASASPSTIRRPGKPIHALARIALLLLLFGLAACSDTPGDRPENATPAPANPNRPRVLYVNSYHRGFAWSDGVGRGIYQVFGVVAGRRGFDDSRARVRFRQIDLDTKRHPEEAFKRQAARRAKEVIDRWQPDLVIASDDNAVKYLVVPYLKDTALPVVFCGVNWDASVYGLPCANVTGMVEVSLEDQVVARLRPYARGGRIGFIGPDVLTTRKEAENVERFLGLDLVTYYAKDADDFLRGFDLLQERSDILLINSDGGLYRDRLGDIIPHVQQEARIPTGAMSNYMKDYALLTIGKVPEEQGEWAATTALAILAGTPPAEIPVARNQRVQIFCNMRMAKRLGIVFPVELIETAFFVDERP